MDRFAYIHGFNSGGNSRSGQELAQLLGVPVICPEYDYSRPFAECLINIRRQIAEAIDETNDRLTVMGSSLGGFFALQLRHPAIIHSVAWNPVVFPAMQLEQFLGKNTRFSDGTDWEFTREILLTYAQAPDPRLWQNVLWAYERRFALEDTVPSGRAFILGASAWDMVEQEMQKAASGSAVEDVDQRIPRRDIFLADADELLDARLTRAFWQDFAVLHDIVSGHQVMDYGHALEWLKRGKILVNFAVWKAGADWAAPFCEAGNYSMAGFFAPGVMLAEACRFLWLAEASFLTLEGEKDGMPYPLVAVFFQPRHEGRMRRLLGGLAKRCGTNSYVLLQSDGTAVRHQCAKNRLQDTERAIELPEGHVFTVAVSAIMPGWQGKRAEWHGREPHGSFNQAVARSCFATLWNRHADPIAAFEALYRPEECTMRDGAVY